ncbi:Pre3p/proteasome regulatory subunit beta type 6, NTN hydrolase fold, putative [Perkinsus marinus ATCC 50983]|uniref:Proteasome subunit beta n=1 Tax=Perkinsus marinus (strain ATCC 50983 / TXsc) TaxID=423536 RepID=C5LRQ6_PERM5|nr:Pre3p/proteasome regulatory subunit beta type 6, NTN hydrolase fold, putative [Perkinsus marinus ATCC 50983]EER00587.1 Pre3p/proteasome regulatory subunit beta type 6, NTN hydrolase fold, putative [Perkinsus marinus ATCC 50983]|eukprot:XP_002767869.1 Pre3p/proteasome regulatory subunit beta type 6, NTN hydrolase fold, putative [Perkinsus marinus ATCC 50983]
MATFIAERQFAKQQHVGDMSVAGVVEQQKDDEIDDLMQYMGYSDNGPAKGIQTGTTIMAMKFKDGVVLGADSRTSTGGYVANRVSRKVTRLHDRIFVCRSGSAADTQFLSSKVKYFLNAHANDLPLDRLPKVKTAANLMRLLAYNNKQYLTAGLIVAGWDQTEGPQVYSIPLGGTIIKQNIATGGSGSTYITGLVDHLYRPDMSTGELRLRG